MEDKKMLSDEELDKVTGGAKLPYMVKPDGTIEIFRLRACCGGVFYKGDCAFMTCDTCEYLDTNAGVVSETGCSCTNPDAVAEMLNRIKQYS